MEPIKLEEHIREKLQDREIQPSEAAWSKLENQLSESDRKSPFLWYAIAASFIGIIIVASFVFTNESSNSNLVEENTIKKVDIENPSDIIENSNAVEQITPIPTETIAVENKQEEKKEVLVSEKANKEKQTFQKKISPQQTLLIAVAEKEHEIPKNEQVKAININDKILEKAKIEEVVAQVKLMQNQNNSVSEVEINSLLLNAQRELQTERILSNSKVDATALLEDIEFEVERSFRDKVFDALGENFDKIRTAVANRNN